MRVEPTKLYAAHRKCDSGTEKSDKIIACTKSAKYVVNLVLLKVYLCRHHLQKLRDLADVNLRT